MNIKALKDLLLDKVADLDDEPRLAKADPKVAGTSPWLRQWAAGGFPAGMVIRMVLLPVAVGIGYSLIWLLCGGGLSGAAFLASSGLLASGSWLLWAKPDPDQPDRSTLRRTALRDAVGQHPIPSRI